MISQGATRCVVCASALTGRQLRYCSRRCKNKAEDGCYPFQQARGWQRKRQLVDLFGGGCVRCSYNRCLPALSFHHQNPAEKKFALDVRSLSTRTWAECLAEAKKCMLLCLNCHAEEHHGQVPGSAVELPALSESEHSERERVRPCPKNVR